MLTRSERCPRFRDQELNRFVHRLFHAIFVGALLKGLPKVLPAPAHYFHTLQRFLPNHLALDPHPVAVLGRGCCPRCRKHPAAVHCWHPRSSEDAAAVVLIPRMLSITTAWGISSTVPPVHVAPTRQQRSARGSCRHLVPA
jgi:hypothetical protein